MDPKRAEEIIQSPTMVHVSYRGIPVYIQNVDPNGQTATVFPLDEMENEQQVDLQGLIEEGP